MDAGGPASQSTSAIDTFAMTTRSSAPSCATFVASRNGEHPKTDIATDAMSASFMSRLPERGGSTGARSDADDSLAPLSIPAAQHPLCPKIPVALTLARKNARERENVRAAWPVMLKD
jgi:hypothetical protein